MTVAQQFEHPNGGEFTFQVNLGLDLTILVVYMSRKVQLRVEELDVSH